MRLDSDALPFAGDEVPALLSVDRCVLNQDKGEPSTGGSAR